MSRIHSGRKFPHDKRALFPCALSTVHTGTCWFVYNGRLTFNEKIPERGQIRTAPSPHQRTVHDALTAISDEMSISWLKRRRCTTGEHSESDVTKSWNYFLPLANNRWRRNKRSWSAAVENVLKVYSGFSKNTINLHNQPIAFHRAQAVDIDFRLDSLNGFFN